jgi:NAD+ synthase
MIKNYKATADYIATWIKNYTVEAKASTLVLGLSGGIDSALCALLIIRTGIPMVCVNMPCHSSASAYNRAKLFHEQELEGKLLKVDLSDAHAVISNQLTDQAALDWTSKGSAGGLRSCLRAPTLSFVAHASNGIIVGTGNRSEDRITRYFQKFGDGCVDFSPIADLWKGEVYELFKFLAEELTGTMNAGAKSIYDAKPSADLWGADSGQEDEKELGISYDEIEWADREDLATDIIFSEHTPDSFCGWTKYTERQKTILLTLWKMEKISRHKSNPNLPVCVLRGFTDLVE